MDDMAIKEVTEQTPVATEDERIISLLGLDPKDVLSVTITADCYNRLISPHL